ncbi:hypothetical protein ACFLXB_08890 [Chloroflexota bacterium]
MSFEDRFENIWRQVSDLELPEPTENKCFYAHGFTEWVEQLYSTLSEPTVVTINQAKVLLLDKYFEWHRYVPMEHRMRLGFRGHICIFQVFEAAYDHLKVIELSLTPPLLFLPSYEEVIAPPQPRLAGIFLGESTDQPKPKEEK